MTSALSKYIVRYCLIWISSFGLLLAITSLAMPGSLGLGHLLVTDVAASPLGQESPLSPLPTVVSAVSGTVEAVSATSVADDGTTRESATNGVTPATPETTVATVTVDNTLTWGEMLVSGRISVALVGALLFGLLLTIGLVLARE